MGELGVLTIVQLVPDLSAKRVKLGFTLDAAAQLADYRSVAPLATCLKHWVCRRAWGPAALDCLASKAGQPLGNNVFDCEDLAGLVHRGDAFFGLMPDPGQTR